MNNFNEPASGSRLHRDDHGHDSRVDELSENVAIHRADEQFSDWEEEANLVAPDAQEGMTQRWVRVSIDGEDDPKNMHKMYRQGWRTRSVDTMPKEFKELGAKKSWSDGILRVDDLVLMEITTKRILSRKAFYEKKTDSLMQAVETDLQRVQVPGNPISQNNRSTVSAPTRKGIAPADD